MDVNNLLSSSAYEDAIYGWGKCESEIGLGHKIRVTFTGLAPKAGYAYKTEGVGLGIRYTWRSSRWWSLLNYNNPLTKLELEIIDGQGNKSWRTLWDKAGA